MMARSTCDGEAGRGTARRSGRHGDVADADEQRLAVDAGETHVQVVGQPALERTIDDDAVELGRQPRQQAIAQPRRAGASPRPSPRWHIAHAAPSPTMPGTFSVPDRRPRSWPPPTISGSSSVCLRTKIAPQPFGPVHLVTGERQQIDLHRVDVDRDLAGRLRGVDVKQRAARVRGSRRSRRAAAATPISLLAAITLTSAVSAPTTCDSASRSIDALAVDGQPPYTRHPCALEALRAPRAPTCARSPTRPRDAATGRPSAAVPCIARLFDSVAPLVK